MKSHSQDDILSYIQQHPGKPVRDIIAHVGLFPTGVFRHLQKLQNQGKIYKTGKPPTVRYYVYETLMESESALAHNIFNWSIASDPRQLSPDVLCPTRDIFQARSEKMLLSLVKELNEGRAYLLLAIIEEVGNNSFDHNLGNWQDVMGVAFEFDEQKRSVLLADRGQGVKKTISRVKPDIASDARALEVAFTEIISGRYPENRGNGLKYVKKVVMEQNFGIHFYSGEAVCTITTNGLRIEKSNVIIPGTFTLITY